MPTFQYLTFVCEQSELQSLLSRYGAEGWRLHTCEPVVAVGQFGTGLLNILVVMDQMIVTEEAELPSEIASEGIAMRG